MPSLTEKTDILGYSNAYHLLRRTTYQITKTRILYFATKTPAQALSELFSFSNPIPPSPLNTNNETIVPTVANPTITDTLNTVSTVKNDKYWWLYQAYIDESAQHKIAAWLHLLFITDDGTSFHTNFDYKELLRFHANKSIKDLAIRMTTNPRMLVFLNNNLNKKNSPNQNYAREFLELFTILKGPQVVKTFSYAFGGASINPGTTETTIQAELENFITMIFNKDETAKAYCRRMYRYFVGRNITTEIETGVIEPLSTILKSNNYNILPTLTALLSSKHFYDEEDAIAGDQIIGALVRSPMELYFHMMSLLNVQIPLYQTNAASIHSLMNTKILSNVSNSGFPLFAPQSVNGYAGYSSSPDYDKNFITTASLRIRYLNTIDTFITGFTYSGFQYKLNLPVFVKDSGYFSSPQSAIQLVTDFFTLLHIEVPSTTRFDYFKDIFLNGLSATNWQNEWNLYLSSNNSNNVKIAIDRLVKALIKSPEFQTF